MLSTKNQILYPAVFLIVVSTAILSYAEDCDKAIELYNKGTLIEDSIKKEIHFKKAIPLCADPEVLSRIYNNLADLYEKEGNYSRALVHYRKAIAVKSDLATSYFSVGDIFLEIEDYYSSYIMYSKGLKYQEDDKKTLENIEKAKEGFREKMLIYFDFDSTEIVNHYHYRLQLIGKSAHDDDLKERKITIRGHTDNSGNETYNQWLSLERAEKVKQHLMREYSLKQTRFEVKALGEGNPLLPNTDREARALNRRVEILITYLPL